MKPIVDEAVAYHDRLDICVHSVTLRAQVTASSEPRTPAFEAPPLTASGNKNQTRALRFPSA